MHLPHVFTPAFRGTDPTGRPQYDLQATLEIISGLLAAKGHSALLADALDIFERELEPLSRAAGGPVFVETSESTDT